MTFSQQILKYYQSLKVPPLPDGIVPLLPFRNVEVQDLMNQFYQRYYNDSHPRILLFGINPGRLGAGKTGIGFTDPVRLKEDCGIDHHLELKPEPSSGFMYEMIALFGGTERFFKHFHFTSVCPFGFVRKGINFNYYDTPDLYTALQEFIIHSIQEQISHPVNRKVAFCVGKGKNYAIFQDLNRQHQWFEHLEVLPHPRWVLQYQRKNMQLHLADYLTRLERYV